MISSIIEWEETMEEMTIRENMRAVEDRIAAACQEAGRKPEDVTCLLYTSDAADD